MKSCVLVAVFACLSLVAAEEQASDLKLIVLPEALAAKHNARCLDGTPPAVYFAPARDEALKTTWVFYLHGGGACTSVNECKSRAKTTQGTSKGIPTTYSLKRVGEPINPDEKLNPNFAGGNRVVAWYCDGMFYSGNLNHTVEGLHFRGFSILEVILEYMLTEHEMDKATDFLLTGCSSGGYSDIFHADYIFDVMKERARGMKRHKTLAISGMFVNATNLEGQYKFGELMRANMILHNATLSVNKYCLEAHKEDPILCAAPENNYAYIRSPIFLAQSSVDYATMRYSYFNPMPPHGSCISKLDSCPVAVIEDVKKVQADCTKIIESAKAKDSIPTISKPGNGGFVDNCLAHCEMEYKWTTLAIDGVKLQEQVDKWWKAPLNAPAEEHTIIERCTFHGKPPYNCNPTC